MKLHLITLLVGALIISGVSAGEYCPPTDDKCVIDCSPDFKGKISFGYETDYIYHGVRLARDSVWADVNYSLEGLLPVPLTVGVFHLSSLGSGNATGNDAFGDETVLYAMVEGPGFLGLNTSVGILQYFYPNTRTASGSGQQIGDSMSEFYLRISRELPFGIHAAYKRTYNYGAPSTYATQAAGGLTNNNTDDRAWIHTLSLSKSIELTECVRLGLSGGVLYTDNLWPTDTTAAVDGSVDRGRSSGWNSYYLRAEVPIQLNCQATLVPYIGYNGTPDSWIADGVNARVPGGNANDILHGGVSVRVAF